MDPIQPAQQTTQPSFVQPEPQEHMFNKVLKITFIFLIIASIGLGAFLLLQIKNINKSPNVVVPTSTISPTKEVKKVLTTISPTVEASNPASVDVGSVETDLKNIGTDVQGLK